MTKVCVGVFIFLTSCLYFLNILLCSGGFRASTFGQRVESAVNNNSVQGVRSDKNRATGLHRCLLLSLLCSLPVCIYYLFSPLYISFKCLYWSLILMWQIITGRRHCQPYSSSVKRSTREILKHHHQP